MANVLKMMKQAASMQREMKQIQKELARKTVEFRSPRDVVTVVARGDMTIDSVTIDPAAMDAKEREKLQKAVVTAVNGALAAAKKQAGSEMSKLTAGMGLGDMLG